MRLHFSVRTLFYGLAAVVIAAVALLGVTIYLRGVTVPNAVLNSPLAQRIGARYGIRFHVDNLRIGCLSRSCPREIAAGAFDLEIQTPEPFRVHGNGTHWNRSGPLTIQGLEVRSGDRPPLLVADSLRVDLPSSQVVVDRIQIGLLPGPPAKIDRLEFDGAAKRITARVIQIQTANQPPVDVNEIRVTGWQASTPDGAIALDRVAVSGVKLKLENRAASQTTICEQLPLTVAMGRQATEPFRPLLPFVQEAFQKLRVDVLRVALAIGAILLVLKLLSVLWFRPWPVQLVLVAIPAVPFAMWYWFHLFLWSAGTLVAVAVLCRVFVYRRGERWYQRWEPFAVDLASLVVLLPLLALRFELPEPPTPPTGLTLARLDLNNLDGQFALAQFRVPQTSVLGVRLALPTPGSSVVEFGLSAIDVPAAAITLADSSRLTLAPVRVDGLRAAYDTNADEVRGITAHIQVGGVAETNRLQKQFQDIEYLKGIQSRSDRVAFDLDLRASDATPQLLERFPNSNHPIAVNAALTLQPAECAATYEVALRILTSPLQLVARADGNAERVDIRSLQTLPDSFIHIAGGHGSAAWTGPAAVNLNLDGIGGTFGSTQVDLNSVGITASLPPLGQSGRQTVAIAFGPIRIQSADVMEVRVGNANVKFNRSPERAGVPLTLQANIENVAFEGRGRGVVQGNIPHLETTVTGQTTLESIPRLFNGAITFRAAGVNSSDELFSADRPLTVIADLWKGLLDIPRQEVILRESMLSETPASLPIAFEMSGRLSSISPQFVASLETDTGLSNFAQTFGSTRVALDGARIAGRLNWDEQGATARLNYRTNWIHAELPAGPSGLCLDEISMLDLTASGNVSSIPETGGLFPASGSSPSLCATLPPLPTTLQFRMSGVLPPGPDDYVVQIERENGSGVRVKRIASQIQNLQLPQGRLAAIATQATVTGIQNLRGAGETGAQIALRRAKDTFQFESRVLAPDGTLLLDAAIASTPAKLTMDAAQHEPADRILSQIGPFLSDMNIDFGNVHAQARLSQLHAEANFAGGEWIDASAVASFAGGDIISTEAPGLSATVVANGQGPALNLKIGRSSGSNKNRTVVAVVDVPGASVHAHSDKNVTIDVDARLSVEAKGSMFMSGPPPASPILENVFHVSSGLSRQAGLLAEVFGPRDTPLPINNLDWNLHLSQNSPAAPLFQFDRDSMQLRIADASFDAAWDGAPGQDRSTIAGSTALDSALTRVGGTDGNPLLVDVRAPLNLKYAFGGQPETHIEANLPIQAVLVDRLHEATATTDSLWNGPYYAQFWRDHPSRFSAEGFVSPIDIGELMIGGLSVQQIRFPLEPLRVVIGYADALQLGLPLSGRVLFGGVEGNLESSVKLSNGQASLDTRLNLDLKDIETSSLGFAMSGVHSAVLEDSLDGRMVLRLDGLTLDRATLPAMLEGKLSADELGKVGMSVHLYRSPGSLKLPGVLQASSQVQLNLVNEFLNQIVKDLRLPATPRALTYKNLDVNFVVDRGLVRTDRAVLELGGLELFSSDILDVKGEVRTHLGGPGERIMLGDLMGMLVGQ